jgi:hypothetical protein
MPRPTQIATLDLAPVGKYVTEVSAIVSTLSTASPSTSALKASLDPIVAAFAAAIAAFVKSHTASTGHTKRQTLRQGFISAYSAFQAGVGDAFRPHFESFLSAARSAYATAPPAARTPDFRKVCAILLKLRFSEVNLTVIVTVLNKECGCNQFDLKIVEAFSGVYAAHTALQSLQTAFENYLFRDFKFPPPPSYKHLIQAPLPSNGAGPVDAAPPVELSAAD